MMTVTFSPGFRGQFDAGDHPAMHTTDLYVRSISQTRNVIKLRLELVCGSEEILLAPNDEDARGQYCQSRNDECSESC